MDHDALRRLQDLIDAADMDHKSVSLAAGLSSGTVNTWFPKDGKPGSDPGADKLMSVAKVLRSNVSFILTGKEPDTVKIPVIGIAAAGEGWTNVDLTHEDVTFDIHRMDAMAIEVRGSSMHPVYRNGDYLVCSGRFMSNFDNLVGLDCVVQIKGGEGLVKILMRGRTRGKYSLKSYNFTVPDIEDVEIEWAAPIDWIKRGSR